MNASSELVPVEKKDTRPGCVSEIGWFFSGAVLPIGSLSFYRKASQRNVGIAILFFLVFTIVTSILSTVALGKSMLGVTRDIRDAYQQGKVPEIAIRGGIAEVSGPQPLILEDQQTGSGGAFIAIDTTGQITSIDQSRYYQGILLTRTELHSLSEGRYQRIPLSQLNAALRSGPAAHQRR